MTAVLAHLGFAPCIESSRLGVADLPSSSPHRPLTATATTAPTRSSAANSYSLPLSEQELAALHRAVLSLPKVSVEECAAIQVCTVWLVLLLLVQ